MFYFTFQLIYLGIVTYGVSTAIESGMYNMFSTRNTIFLKGLRVWFKKNNNRLVKKLKFRDNGMRKLVYLIFKL